MFCIAFFLAIVNITLEVRLQTTVPSNYLGRVISILLTANNSIMPVGTLIFTFFYEVLPNSTVVLIVNGILLAGYLVLLAPTLSRDTKLDETLITELSQK